MILFKTCVVFLKAGLGFLEVQSVVYCVLVTSYLGLGKSLQLVHKGGLGGVGKENALSL